MQLKVVTYNIHKGLSFYSRKSVLSELRQAIRLINADVVFLQEVMGAFPNHKTKVNFESQFEYLADEIWSHYAYGKNAVYSSGHHGNAILSKFPIVQWENINVSNNRFEQRGILHAEIHVDAVPVHLVCLHFDLLERGRVKQMQRLVERVSSHVPVGHGLIVAGDFNDWRRRLTEPLEETLKVAEAGIQFSGRHVPSFPVWRPIFALDRIYTRGFEVIDYKVLNAGAWRRMSDHAAISVDLMKKSDKHED